jgi:hypothetical protein
MLQAKAMGVACRCALVLLAAGLIGINHFSISWHDLQPHWQPPPVEFSLSLLLGVKVWFV